MLDWGDITPLRTKRLSEEVLDALREMILSGQLQPGDQLPSERALAELFGVGRNSVREAIRQLSAVGLVEAYQGGGTFVLAPDSQALVRPFRSVVELASTTPEQMIEFRLILEPAMASIAASRADEAMIGRLVQAHADFEEAMQAKNDPARPDTVFHQIIAESTGNPMLLGVEEALMELLYNFRRDLLLREAYDPQGPGIGHRLILEAIQSGDAQGAADAMRAHLKDVRKYMRTSHSDDR